MNSSLNIRAYDAIGPLHSHDFVQIVMQLDGALEIEVSGAGARLTSGLSAFIAPGEKHTQAGLVTNRSLVLDAPPRAFPAQVIEDLRRKRYFKTSTGLHHLIGFAAQRGGTSPLTQDDLGALSVLLTGAMGVDFADRSELDALGDAILQTPAADWSVTRMAREMGVSRSVLYRRLAVEGKGPPGRYVAKIRVKAACLALADTGLSIADIALRCGFSDQSALTRSMRRQLGETPARWRGK